MHSRRKKREQQRKELLKQAEKDRKAGKLPAGKQWWEKELENQDVASDDDDAGYFEQEVRCG